MKISVIIPCYNQAFFLKETCISVLNQTYANWEVLLINDGSTDATENVAKEMCDLDDRFKYYYKENGGLSSARNFGLDKATGDFIQFLDSDDLLLPTKFEKSIKSGAELCISNFEMFRTKREAPFCKLEGEDFTFVSVLTNWDVKFSIPIHCGFFSAKIIGNLRFDQNLKAKEDWVFWLNFLKKEPKTLFVNEPLAIYRQHNSNMCKDKKHMEENSKLVYGVIYSILTEEYKELFFNKIAVDFVNERSKCDYLFLKYKKEKKRKNKLTTIFGVFSGLLIIALTYALIV